jgi:hypothetical protein
VDHLISGRPIGISIERAAVVAEPILHGLFLIGATVFVAWRFGPFAACLVSVGLAGVFPFAAGFLPGIPDDHGLARIGVLASALALLAGVGSIAAGAKPEQRPRTSPATRTWFCVAGVLGGLGMWVSVSIGVPVIAGIFLGALIAAGIARQHAKAAPDQAITPALWRTWGISGGATVMAAFFVEYPPAQMLSWRLESVHPLYAVAWIGAAELLARLTNWIQPGRRPSGWRDGAIVLGARRGRGARRDDADGWQGFSRAFAFVAVDQPTGRRSRPTRGPGSSDGLSASRGELASAARAGAGMVALSKRRHSPPASRWPSSWHR